MQSDKKEHLGFPVPLLGMEPKRLAVLWDDGDHLVLEKPADVLVTTDHWYLKTPVLVDAIGYQAQQGKPEFVRKEIGEAGLFAVYTLDPEITGPVLFTRKEETAVRLRNALGSEELTFTFHLLCESCPEIEEVFCDLPLARHTSQRNMVVSHRTGKKAQTEFRLLERVGRYTLWQASTHFMRMHQVRVHAVESGLTILGEQEYAESPPLLLSRIKRGYRLSRKVDEEKPLHTHPLIHLVEVGLPGGITFSAPPPKQFIATLRQIRRHR